MSIEELLKKRKQIKFYDNNKIPEKSLIESIIKKTFELVPSKQNLMPYKIHILGPEKDIKQEFYNIVKLQTGGAGNFNVTFAPYCLIFTTRLVTNPNKSVSESIKKGCPFAVCDPINYNKMTNGTSIEVGMFAKVLTLLCIENNIDVSYTLCFPSWQQNKEKWKKLNFINDIVLFSMQLGYKSTIGNNKKDIYETKPNIDEVINWL